MMIDIHIHMAGTGSESTCFISDYMKTTPAYLIMLITTKMIFKKVNDKTIRQHLLKILNDSKLDRGVFLAMDKAYNSKGKKITTHLYTPNDYVASMANKEKKVLFGASIHPDRKDAINEMEKAADNGAVLMKWIPSSQNINPKKKKYHSFYRKMVDLELPLLCHVGAEHTIPEPKPLLKSHYHKYNDPENLIPALECGVKVIAAHCCTPVFFMDTLLFKDYFKDFLSLMKKSIKKGWKLYADLSALTFPSPYRISLIKEIRDNIPTERLILGSDYPIPISSLWTGAGGEVDKEEWERIRKITNPLDKNVETIRALGFDEQVFHNAEKILRIT